jgi:hypothetical protein
LWELCGTAILAAAFRRLGKRKTAGKMPAPRPHATLECFTKNEAREVSAPTFINPTVGYTWEKRAECARNQSGESMGFVFLYQLVLIFGLIAASFYWNNGFNSRIPIRLVGLGVMTSLLFCLC